MQIMLAIWWSFNIVMIISRIATNLPSDEVIDLVQLVLGLLPLFKVEPTGKKSWILKNSHIMSFLIDAWPQAALFSFPSPPLNHPQLVSHHTGTHIYFTNQCFSLPSASTSNLFPLLTQALGGLFVGLPQAWPVQQSYDILSNLSPRRVQGYSPKQRLIEACDLSHCCAIFLSELDGEPYVLEMITTYRGLNTNDRDHVVRQLTMCDQVASPNLKSEVTWFIPDICHFFYTGKIFGE